jgi:hypothetical protein
VKGKALRGPGQAAKPRVLVHFQTLRPQPDGSVKVLLSSGETDWPLDGDSQQITVIRPLNHCIYAGDYVAFNTWGGHEWRFGQHGGVPLQIFSRRPGSQLAWYEKDQGTNNGAQFHSYAPREGRELLMQAVLATGPDATDICEGGYQQHVFTGLDVEGGQNAVLRVNEEVAKVRATCPGPTYGACKGALRLEANLGGQDVVLGTKGFNMAPGTTTNIEVPIPVENITLVQQVAATAADGVPVRTVADAHDDPRAVNQLDVPVQNKVTTTDITITPDLLGSKAACDAARIVERKAIKSLKAWKKRQARAATSKAKKAAYRRVKKWRRAAVRATEARRAACS